MNKPPLFDVEDKTLQIMLNTALNALEYAQFDAQYLAMMVLRYHGYDVQAQGYWENESWLVTIGDEQFQIIPHWYSTQDNAEEQYSANV